MGGCRGEKPRQVAAIRWNLSISLNNYYFKSFIDSDCKSGVAPFQLDVNNKNLLSFLIEQMCFFLIGESTANIGWDSRMDLECCYVSSWQGWKELNWEYYECICINCDRYKRLSEFSVGPFTLKLKLTWFNLLRTDYMVFLLKCKKIRISENKIQILFNNVM